MTLGDRVRCPRTPRSTVYNGRSYGDMMTYNGYHRGGYNGAVEEFNQNYNAIVRIYENYRSILVGFTQDPRFAPDVFQGDIAERNRQVVLLGNRAFCVKYPGWNKVLDATINEGAQRGMLNIPDIREKVVFLRAIKNKMPLCSELNAAAAAEAVVAAEAEVEFEDWDEAEARARALAEAEADDRARAQARARAREEAEAEADAIARAETKARAREEADARAREEALASVADLRARFAALRRN